MACDLQLGSKNCYPVQDFCEVIIGWNYKEYSVDEARVHELLSQTEPLLWGMSFFCLRPSVFRDRGI